MIGKRDAGHVPATPNLQTYSLRMQVFREARRDGQALRVFDELMGDKSVQPDVSIFSMAVDSCAGIGDTEKCVCCGTVKGDAHEHVWCRMGKVLDEMKARGIDKDMAVRNGQILCTGLQKGVDAAMELMEMLVRDEKFAPNDYTWNILLTICMKRDTVDTLLQRLERMQQDSKVGQWL
jgi:hypothetical protein